MFSSNVAARAPRFLTNALFHDGVFTLSFGLKKKKIFTFNYGYFCRSDYILR